MRQLSYQTKPRKAQIDHTNRPSSPTALPLPYISPHSPTDIIGGCFAPEPPPYGGRPRYPPARYACSKLQQPRQEIKHVTANALYY